VAAQGPTTWAATPPKGQSTTWRLLAHRSTLCDVIDKNFRQIMRIAALLAICKYAKAQAT
jgi:hypothetical protein